MNILIGCDPELFIKRRTDGQFHSAHGLIPGTKDEPFKVDKGAYQIDGMALEFNIDPAATAEEFEGNIRRVMEQLREAVPEEFEFALEPTATFSKDHFDLQPEEAKELGCTPDFNAYTLEENPRPDNKTTMRTASGHVHIGFCEGADTSSMEHMVRCATLVKHLDWYLGIPSLLYDKDNKRRTMYGALGAFRPKPYGVEYRVLSNRWLSDPKLIRWVFNQTKACVEDLIARKGKTNNYASTYFHPNYASSITSLSNTLTYAYNETGQYDNMSRVLKGFPKL